MNKFLSCDWGTSSFRLRLVNAEDLTVLAEELSDKGIGATHGLWKETGDTDAERRLLFYLNIIREYIESIERRLELRLHGVPLILSGMASSSIGLLALPYCDLPFAVNGSDAGIKYFEHLPGFNRPLLLISGVKSDDDVMRGEETQLVGVVAGGPDTDVEATYIFPGTHSKHIRVNDKQIVGFKTFMTGEFFEVLSKKSILSAGVEPGYDLLHSNSLSTFKKGVQDAIGANLLHASFLVRTNELFGKLTKGENFYYLSGLLIGTELQEIRRVASVYLCCGSKLKPLYETALELLRKGQNVRVFPERWVEEAVIRGQFRIFNQFKHKR